MGDGGRTGSVECFLPSMPSNSHSCIETRSERKHTDRLELIQSQRDSFHPHQTNSPPLYLQTSDVQLTHCCCCCFLTWHQSWIRFSPRSLREALVSTFLSFTLCDPLLAQLVLGRGQTQLLLLPSDRDRGVCWACILRNNNYHMFCRGVGPTGLPSTDIP